MSDTPETDAELFKVYEGPQFSPTVHLCVDPDFARKLERQRNELLEALEFMVEVNGGVSVMPTAEAKSQNKALASARAAIAKAKEELKSLKQKKTMPCNSEYLDATNLEIEISRVACLLDETKGKKKFDKNHWNGYHPEVYGKITRGLADEYTAKLCSILRKKDVTKYSLEMQIWWRDHKKADKVRLRKEKLETEKEIKRAERKLKEAQEKLEQLQEQPSILIK